MSELMAGMKGAADALADATIAAFWNQYDARMQQNIQQAGQRISPEIKLRGMLVQAFSESVAAGWIDPSTYAYQTFVHCDLLSIPEVLEFLAEQVAENGMLTTHDLQIANELFRLDRERKRQKKQSWLARLFK